MEDQELIIRIFSIRISAKRQVGSCSDYQITFCAMKANVIERVVYNLDDLLPMEIENISIWLLR